MPDDNKKLYSVGDARAELHRIIEQTKPARQVLHRALGAIRKIGEESGFKVDAERAVEMLRHGALGDGFPSAAAKPMSRAEPVGKHCRLCGLVYSAGSKCPACEAARLHSMFHGLSASTPRWMKQLLVAAKNPDDMGLHPMVLEKTIEYPHAGIEISARAQVQFRPTLLLIDGIWSDGIIDDMRIGTELLCVSDGSIPMNTYCPSRWADPALMAKAAIAGRIMGVGEKFSLTIRAGRKGDFRALVLGKAILPGDVRMGPSPHLLPEDHSWLGVARRSYAYGQMTPQRQAILEKALKSGTSEQCLKIAEAFETEGRPEEAKALREAATARHTGPVTLQDVAANPGMLTTRKRELPCPKCGSEKATRSHCPACNWTVSGQDLHMADIIGRTLPSGLVYLEKNRYGMHDCEVSRDSLMNAHHRHDTPTHPCRVLLDGKWIS